MPTLRPTRFRLGSDESGDAIQNQVPALPAAYSRCQKQSLFRGIHWRLSYHRSPFSSSVSCVGLLAAGFLFPLVLSAGALLEFCVSLIIVRYGRFEARIL